MGGFKRENVYILSNDGKNKLHAWVYKPDEQSRSRVPAVVMWVHVFLKLVTSVQDWRNNCRAHGFGLNKAFGLQSYAEPFAQSGRIVVVFDYRWVRPSSSCWNLYWLKLDTSVLQMETRASTSQSHLSWKTIRRSLNGRKLAMTLIPRKLSYGVQVLQEVT